MSKTSEILELAHPLLKQAGIPPALDAIPMDGGRNNLVDKLTFADHEPLVLKRYFHDKRDTRDRLGAEYAFLELAWERGVENVPKPLACDQTAHTGLYNFVAGAKLEPSELGKRHVDAALDFVVSINEGGCPDGFAIASEACFSMEDHISTVARRVARLDDLDPGVPYSTDAARLVKDHLFPVWDDYFASLQRADFSELDKGIRGDRVISPSDFGFHNALVSDDDTVFLDFEYAGVDDPAKLVCDFFCQPEVPVDNSYLERFIQELSGRLELTPHFQERAVLLLKAYRVKWSCIMMNEFATVGSKRRMFSSGGADWEQRCKHQLERVEMYLQHIA
jgi:Phosphotransferase enzyme family